MKGFHSKCRRTLLQVHEACHENEMVETKSKYFIHNFLGPLFPEPRYIQRYSKLRIDVKNVA